MRAVQDTSLSGVGPGAQKSTHRAEKNEFSSPGWVCSSAALPHLDLVLRGLAVRNTTAAREARGPFVARHGGEGRSTVTSSDLTGAKTDCPSPTGLPSQVSDSTSLARAMRADIAREGALTLPLPPRGPHRASLRPWQAPTSQRRRRGLGHREIYGSIRGKVHCPTGL